MNMVNIMVPLLKINTIRLTNYYKTMFQILRYFIINDFTPIFNNHY